MKVECGAEGQLPKNPMSNSAALQQGSIPGCQSTQAFFSSRSVSTNPLSGRFAILI